MGAIYEIGALCALDEALEGLDAGSGALGTQLARHGIGLRAEVLDDRRRRLVALPQPAGRVGEAMVSLRSALDDLGHALPPGLRAAR